jgi:hypothetical protein
MEELESDLILRKFLEEMADILENKITALCSGINTNVFHSKSLSLLTDKEERKKILLDKLANLYPWLSGWAIAHVFPVKREKDLPVSLENFSDGEFDRIDEILEKIIRYESYREVWV